MIYLVRDGRDVMRSYFKFRHGLHQTLSQNFDTFLHPKKEHYPGVTWAKHARDWLNAQDKMESSGGQFLFLRYEDLKEDTLKELARVIDFLGIPTNTDRVRHAMSRAVQLSSKDSMAKIEQKFGSGFFKRRYKSVSTYNAFKFVSNTTLRQRRQPYTQKQREIFLTYNKDMMVRLGYMRKDEEN